MPVLKNIPDFAELNELASKRNGARILFATIGWFAVAENLLKETRRKRIAGHDWAIIALGRLSVMKGVCVDTAFFTGNYAPRFSIQAARFSYVLQEWTTLVSMTELQPGCPETSKNYVAVSSDGKWTHLRINILPHGGIARLRV